MTILFFIILLPFLIGFFNRYCSLKLKFIILLQIFLFSVLFFGIFGFVIGSAFIGALLNPAIGKFILILFGLLILLRWLYLFDLAIRGDTKKNTSSTTEKKQ